MAEKRLAIIKFRDPNDSDVFMDYVVYTTHSESELQEAVDKIKKQFYDEGFEDWTFDDMMEELKKQGFIERLPEDIVVDWVELYA